MKNITQKQRHTFDIIAQFIGQRGISPTFTELRVMLGISSNQSLIDRLTSLETRGLLLRNPKRHRSISLGPKAAADFCSFEGYITQPMQAVTYDQSISTLNSNIVNSNIFVGNSTALISLAHSQ